jgi:glycosyltransferase involved in cell wall biosynthesis
MDTWLRKRVFPSTFAVRGDYVAIDSLAEALAREGSMDAYEIYSHPAFIDGLKQRIHSNWQVQGDRIHVHPISALLKNTNAMSLKALVAPAITFAEPFRLRECIDSPLFPILAVSHGFSLHTILYDTFLRILLADTYACDSIICTSRASAIALSSIFEQVSEQFNREFGTKVKFSGRIDRIPLCVDTKKLQPQDKLRSRHRFGFPKDAFILLFMGRVSLLKADLSPLLHVFRSLIKQNVKHELILVIAGTRDEPYVAILEEYLKEQSLEKNVRFVSDIPDEDKASLFSAADLFVAPADSVQESFGLSPIEAMSCGLPQVVADWDGYRDTIKHGETGFLIPTYWMECDRDLSNTGLIYGWRFDHLCLGQSVAMDLRALESALQTMIDNDALRQEMSVNSRRRAESLYSYGAVAEQYEALCIELSRIAGSIPSRQPCKTFGASHYFQFFKNHASRIIEDHCILAITAFGQEMHGPMLSSMLKRVSHDFQVIDGDLVQRAIEQIAGASHRASESEPSPTTTTFGELVDILAQGHNYQRDFVCRNVMWLIKQGLVEICAGEARQ